MILSVFIMLLTLGIGLVFLGWYLPKPSHPIIITGWLFIFLLGLTVLGVNDNLQVKSGDFINETTATTTTVTHQYTNFQSKTYGFYMCVIAALGFGITMWNVKSRGPS